MFSQLVNINSQFTVFSHCKSNLERLNTWMQKLIGTRKAVLKIYQTKSDNLWKIVCGLYNTGFYFQQEAYVIPFGIFKKLLPAMKHINTPATNCFSLAFDFFVLLFKLLIYFEVICFRVLQVSTRTKTLEIKYQCRMHYIIHF